MARLTVWRLFIHFILSWAASITATDNSSFIYSPEIRDQQQQVLEGAAGHSPYSLTSAEYLRLSLKQELSSRLSPEAAIFLEGSEDFAVLDARYTNYKRPDYIAAVKVAEEKDVIETVSLFQVTISSSDSNSFNCASYRWLMHALEASSSRREREDTALPVRFVALKKQSRLTCAV
jgi:hypothetical protein